MTGSQELGPDRLKQLAANVAEIAGIQAQLLEEIARRRKVAADDPAEPFTDFQRAWLVEAAALQLELARTLRREPTLNLKSESKDLLDAIDALVLDVDDPRQLGEREGDRADWEHECRDRVRTIDLLMVAATPWHPYRIAETWSRIRWLPESNDGIQGELGLLATEVGTSGVYLVRDGNHRFARLQYLGRRTLEVMTSKTGGVFLPPPEAQFFDMDNWVTLDSEGGRGRTVPRGTFEFYRALGATMRPEVEPWFEDEAPRSHIFDRWFRRRERSW